MANMPLKLVRYDHDLLSKELAPVQDGEDLAELAAAMAELVESANGFAIAANQVGIDKRLVVFNRNFFKHSQGKSLTGSIPGDAWALANPVVVPDLSRPQLKFQAVPEGCLSFPGTSVKVLRFPAVKLSAKSLSGAEVSGVAVKMAAIVLQHEMEHLNGYSIVSSRPESERSAILRALERRIRRGS